MFPGAILYLNQFNLNIKFIPGHKNKVADCLTIIQEDMNSKQIEILIPNAKENAQDFILAINEIGPTVDSDLSLIHI